MKSVTSLILLGLLSSALLASDANICVGGQDPSKMSNKDYMAAFAKGPCSPIVLLPGITGSVLQLEITNCQLLRDTDPQTFLSCGWVDCKGGAGSPKKEYRMWAPDVNSPMNILSPLEIQKDCFAGLVSVHFKATAFVPTDKPGTKMTILGLSPETRTKSQCGVMAIQDFIQGIPNPEGTANMKAVNARILQMGYKAGLTFQPCPYDWRLPANYDQASKYLPQLLANFKQLTNKKPIIVAHSMGNLKTVTALWNMNQTDKDNLVQLYVAIAPPYIGANKPIGYLTCGSPEYFFPDNLGLDMKTWKAVCGTSPAVYELVSQATYKSQAGTPWMTKIMNRIAYEQGKSNDPVFPFLPLREDICYPAFTQNKCLSGAYVLDNYGTYMNTMNLTNSNLRQWMNAHAFNRNVDVTWALVDPRYETIPNPNVPIVTISARVAPTEGIYDFKQDPKITSSENQFCATPQDESWTNMSGDDTVPSTSVITANLKWGIDFTNKVANAKPIKMVDVCSTFNIQPSPYDTTSGTGARIMTKLEYSGLPCDCTQNKIRHCTHVGMLFAQSVLDYLANTFTTNDVQPVSDMVNNMTEQQLAAYVTNCDLYWTLNPGNGEEVKETKVEDK